MRPFQYKIRNFNGFIRTVGRSSCSLKNSGSLICLVTRDSFSNRPPFFNAGLPWLYPLFVRNCCSISHPFFVNSEYQRCSCVFSVDIVAQIWVKLLLDSSSFHDRCMHRYIGFQMWTCSACRGNAKDPDVFSERCPSLVSVPAVVHGSCL